MTDQRLLATNRADVNDANRRRLVLYVSIEDLRNADLRRRCEAGLALLRAGAPAVEPLIAGLRHEDPEVRWRAAVALGWIGDVRAVEPLVEALHEPVYDMRHSVIWALGMIGDSRAFEPLLPMLGDPDEAIATAAAFALTAVDRPRAVEWLRAAMSDPGQRIWKIAKAALLRLGNV